MPIEPSDRVSAGGRVPGRTPIDLVGNARRHLAEYAAMTEDEIRRSLAHDSVAERLTVRAFAADLAASSAAVDIELAQRVANALPVER